MGFGFLVIVWFVLICFLGFWFWGCVCFWFEVLGVLLLDCLRIDF